MGKSSKGRYYQKQNIKLKRMKNINHLFRTDFVNQYNGLSKIQRTFIQMQLRTVQQAPTVSMSIVVKNVGFNEYILLNENGSKKSKEDIITSQTRIINATNYTKP